MAHSYYSISSIRKPIRTLVSFARRRAIKHITHSIDDVVFVRVSLCVLLCVSLRALLGPVVLFYFHFFLLFHKAENLPSMRWCLCIWSLALSPALYKTAAFAPRTRCRDRNQQKETGFSLRNKKKSAKIRYLCI